MKMKEDNLYKYFVVLYTVIGVVTIWNIREQHKLRELQKEELVRKGNGK